MSYRKLAFLLVLAAICICSGVAAGVPDPDMVSYLRFNYTPGTANFSDEAGISWASLGAGSPAPSIDQSTYKFWNGSGKFASTTTGLSAANGSQWVWGKNHTVEFWIYPTSTGLHQILFWQGSVSYSPVELRYQGGTGYKNVTLYASSANASYDLVNGAFSPANSVPLNSWSHIEIDYASPTITVYVNGRSNITATLASDPFVSPGNMTISKPAGSGIAGAYLDEFVVWDTTRHLSNFVPETLGYDIPVLDTYFTGTPVTGTAALLVSFSDVSLNVSPGATYYWDFGDGETSTDENPLHVYADFGTYDVNHSVTLLDGQTDFQLQEDFVITSSEQSQPWYSPLQVQITVLDYLGSDVEGATVTANYVESTLPSAAAWLASIYGIDEDIAAEMLSQNVSMTGVTGSDGAITFTMHSSLKYWINVSGGGSVINETVYPKENSYNIWLPAPSVENLYEVVNATLTFTEPNSSYFTMGGVFQDHSGNTSAMLFYVNATNGTPIYQTSVAPGTGNISLNHTVENVRGEGYYWGIRCTRTGGNVSLDQGVTGKGPSGVLVDLGIPSFYYAWISLFLLFLVTSIASKANVRFFALLMPMFAAMLWWFGWMSGAYLAGVIPFACCLGAVYYMKGSLRENYGVGGPGSMLMNIVVFLIIFQLMIGFVNGLGVFDQAAAMTPSNQFTNVDLTTIQNEVQNFGGINDPLQSANAFASIGWSTIKIALSMVASVFVVGIFLIEMFPYVPAGFIAILQAGIWILYILFIVRLVGKAGTEVDY